MKSLQECIESRRSVRNFQDRPVDRDLVRELVRNACMAPSGSNIQPWEFIVADQPELVREIVTFSPGIGYYPPCILILCVDKERAFQKGGAMGRDQLSVFDIAMAAENIMLSAVDFGLGTCAVRSFSSLILQKLLKLPEHIVPELMVTLGYPTKDGKKPPKRPVSELLHFNGWGDRDAEEVV